MMTNLLGRRVRIADDTTTAEFCRGKAGYVVGVGHDDEAFWLLIELVESGRLVTTRAGNCTVAPAPPETT